MRKRHVLSHTRPLDIKRSMSLVVGDEEKSLDCGEMELELDNELGDADRLLGVVLPEETEETEDDTCTLRQPYMP